MTFKGILYAAAKLRQGRREAAPTPRKKAGAIAPCVKPFPWARGVEIVFRKRHATAKDGVWRDRGASLGLTKKAPHTYGPIGLSTWRISPTCVDGATVPSPSFATPVFIASGNKGIEEEEYRLPLKRENCPPAERQFGDQGTGR